MKTIDFKMKTAFGAACALLTFAAAAPAQAGVGDSGCGLGHLAWQGKNGKIAQILASTTNGTFGSQTFGISTGTSGCTASGMVRADKEQEYFANVNRDALYHEMARGEGENVAALAALMGCTDVRAFATFTKSQYEALFPTSGTTGAEMLANLRAQMAKEERFSKGCGRVTAQN